MKIGHFKIDPGAIRDDINVDLFGGDLGLVRWRSLRFAESRSVGID
ncbi:hypothetical protein [Chamaesiphon polymorphus]|nr:hypothetical protein [Chamaesiphon polymorphus]